MGSSHVHGDLPAALEALSALAPVVLYGERFRRRPPSQEFLASLGGATEDEPADLDGLPGAVTAAGFEIVRESLASEGNWARYEETLAANAERHGGRDALRYARQIRERRARQASSGRQLITPGRLQLGCPAGGDHLGIDH